MKKIDDAVLAEMAASGLQAKAIAAHFGVSGQAVRSKAARMGVALARRVRKVSISEKYGLPMSEVWNLRRIGATAAFIRQRQNAHTRGIEWNLTFGEWWSIWSESGRWEQRGKLKGGWVMGRYGDVGPYVIGNVVICTHSDNAKVAQSHAVRTVKAMARVVFDGRATNRPYIVRLRHKYIGSFATEAEAVARKNEINMDA